jgi:hypothetical protein
MNVGIGAEATQFLFWKYLFQIGFALWMYLEDDWKLAWRGTELF